MNDQPIIVKFLFRGSRRRGPEMWLRQFPHGEPVWGRCRYVFDPDAREYDWLAVYDDLPKAAGGRVVEERESLACSPEHTILLTVEPSSIKLYGRRFARQFGCVLTSQEPWALPHADAVRSQPALRWFYGAGKTRLRTFDQMVVHPPLEKTRTISIVSSSKRQRHTLHHRRHRFAGELKALLSELDIYGHGIRGMDDKAEALDPYRYHVAVENHVGPDHWTEKLADSFLGCCLPFYYGCPNAADYFPEKSFIPIDIFDAKAAAHIIRAAIANNEYERRREFIMEARDRVLREYNTFAVLSKLIEQRHSRSAVRTGATLLSRHALRSASLMDAVEGLFMKIRGRLRHLAAGPKK